MAEVRAYDVASMFLRALGAPDTTNMRRAVAIWLRFESGGRITGNNPWNLHNGPPCKSSSRYCPGVGSLPGQIGNRYAGPGDQNVAVFRTLNDGVRANANNLIRLSPSYGYGVVISEARQGDAIGFLRALQNSSWSAGHYGYSKLVNAFGNGLNYNSVMTTSMPTGVGTTPAGPPQAEPGKSRVVKFPFRSIVEKFDFLTSSSTFSKEAADLYAVVLLDVPQYIYLISGQEGLLLDRAAKDRARERIRLTVNSYVGDKVSELPGELTVVFQADETKASETQGPLDAIAGALGGLGNVFAFLLDPNNWLYIFALLGGLAMTAYGFAQLTGARSPVSMVGATSGEGSE